MTTFLTLRSMRRVALFEFLRSDLPSCSMDELRQVLNGWHPRQLEVAVDELATTGQVVLNTLPDGACLVKVVER